VTQSVILIEGVIYVKLEKARERKRNKKRNRYIYRASVLFILIAATIFALYSSNQSDKTAHRTGDEAPDFKLNQLNENYPDSSFQLSDFKGKGIMINFWDTSCTPCKDEIPFLLDAYEQYQNKDIEFIAVSLDVNDFVVSKYIHNSDLTYPVVRDSKSQVKNLYKIGSLPSKIFIDENGMIVDTVQSKLELQELQSYLDQIVPN